MNMPAAPLIGQPVDRAEDRRFLTGAGTFVDDLKRDGMLHAVVLRSSVAHGRINGIDTSAARAREGVRAVKGWLTTGLAVGLVAVVLLHDTDLIDRIVGHSLPGDMDPLRRVRGYKATTDYVESARQKLLQEGKQVFIICDHYGITGLFSFYLPPARAALRGNPLVYYKSSDKPNNQLFFWPEYRYAERRKGENAIYATEPGTARLEKDWLWRWLSGKEEQFSYVPPLRPPPPDLVKEFESVTDLGVHEIRVGGRIMKRVQLFECRYLK